ncbi:RNA-binding protein 47-like [Macrosteles quadrilineatus]|uniref:RNA-binding protein 47-like n=1 Tax=Macrosteles quadrilineatus TaxID=74068 RepID=UPI0023E0F877|nr:RNA-binding protein 47-like [Macrosteles quadrilineatus]
MDSPSDVPSAAERFPSRQINGCRLYGPNEAFKAFSPRHGSELFLARIPTEFSHRELLRICEEAGVVFELRVMVDFLNVNKGYGFVKYLTPDSAVRAIKALNGYRLIQDGKYLGHLVATSSSDHRTLMLTGCSATVTTEDVELVFRKLDNELVSVTKDFERGMTSPVFYLTFSSHRSAAIAKKCTIEQLAPSCWGHWVRLNWQPNEEVAKRVQYKLLRKELRGMNFRQSQGVLQQVPTNAIAYGVGNMQLQAGFSPLGATNFSTPSQLVGNIQNIWCEGAAGPSHQQDLAAAAGPSSCHSNVLLQVPGVPDENSLPAQSTPSPSGYGRPIRGRMDDPTPNKCNSLRF